MPATGRRSNLGEATVKKQARRNRPESLEAIAEVKDLTEEEAEASQGGIIAILIGLKSDKPTTAGNLTVPKPAAHNYHQIG
jgi:hypothetical protein